MNFKLDENLPVEAADLMRKAGHDVKTVPDEKLQGARDPLLLDRCIAEDRVLVSLDTEFADIRAYPRKIFLKLLFSGLSLKRKHKFWKSFADFCRV